MQSIDNTNYRYGRSTISLASAGINKKWSMRRQYSSKIDTADFYSLPKILANQWGRTSPMFESDASNSLMFSLLDKLKIINKNMISKNKGKIVIKEIFLFMMAK